MRNAAMLALLSLLPHLAIAADTPTFSYTNGGRSQILYVTLPSTSLLGKWLPQALKSDTFLTNALGNFDRGLGFDEHRRTKDKTFSIKIGPAKTQLVFKLGKTRLASLEQLKDAGRVRVEGGSAEVIYKILKSNLSLQFVSLNWRNDSIYLQEGGALSNFVLCDKKACSFRFTRK